MPDLSWLNGVVLAILATPVIAYATALLITDLRRSR